MTPSWALGRGINTLPVHVKLSQLRGKRKRHLNSIWGEGEGRHQGIVLRVQHGKTEGLHSDSGFDTSRCPWLTLNFFGH